MILIETKWIEIELNRIKIEWNKIELKRTKWNKMTCNQNE